MQLNPKDKSAVSTEAALFLRGQEVWSRGRMARWKAFHLALWHSEMALGKVLAFMAQQRYHSQPRR